MSVNILIQSSLRLCSPSGERSHGVHEDHRRDHFFLCRVRWCAPEALKKLPSEESARSGDPGYVPREEEEDRAKPARDGPFGAIIVLARLPGFLSFREVAMLEPTWQALYRAALAEPDPIRLNSRIEAARRAIRQGLEQIEDSGDTRERQQLNDALHALLTLAARKRSS